MACCYTEQQADGVRERLEGWLAARGLSLNLDKTRIVHLTQGLDFLGWNFRRYPGPKLLIKPSRAAIRKHRQRLASETRRLRGSNARAVIAALNPLIGGWTSYHRGMVSSRIFTSLGSHTWKLTWKWARYSHPGKSGRWITSRYYGAFNPSRQDNWVFGDRETGIYLRNHAWTRIRRHVTVRGAASPDDPRLAGYWRYRRNKHGIPLDSGTLILLSRQHGRCPQCGNLLIDALHLPASPEEWQDWWYNVTRTVTRRAASTPGQQPGPRETTTSLIHAPCNRSLQRQRRNASTALQPAAP